MITIFDAILLLILFGFVFYGLFKGLLKMVADIVSIIGGALIAAHYYIPFSEWLAQFDLGGENLLRIIGFIVLFGIASKLIILLFNLLNKIFKVISIIPFVKGINKIVGAILGFTLGALILGLLIVVISKYSLTQSLFGSWIEASQVAPFLSNFAEFLMPLFPEAFRAIKSNLNF